MFYHVCVCVSLYKQTIWCGQQSLRKCRKCQKLLPKPAGANEIGSRPQTKSKMLIMFSFFRFSAALLLWLCAESDKKANALPSRPQKFNHQCGRQHSRKQLSISILGFQLTKGPAHTLATLFAAANEK